MKGLSPLIGIILLIGITFGMFIIFFGWGSGYIKSSQKESEKSASKSLQCSLADVSIDNAIYNATSGNFSIIVTNAGNVDFNPVVFTFITDKGSKDYEIHETLGKGEKKVYKIHFDKGCEVNLIHVSTPCENAKDEIIKEKITFLGC